MSPDEAVRFDIWLECVAQMQCGGSSDTVPDFWFLQKARTEERKKEWKSDSYCTVGECGAIGNHTKYVDNFVNKLKTRLKC